MKQLVPALALASLASAASGQNQLWIVDDDGGPGVDFTTIQAGIDASGDGDVVLVRDGSYGGAVIDGKGVSVVGDDGASVVIPDLGLRIRNTAVGQDVLIQNLDVNGVTFFPFTAGDPAIAIENCAGIVTVQDSQAGPDAFGFGGGAHVTGSSAVSFSRCQLDGGLGSSAFIIGGSDGLVATSSTVAIYDSVLDGGFGPGGACTLACGPAGPAGSGAVLDGSFLFASGSAFLGDDGGDGDDACSILSLGGEGADGGSGVLLKGGSVFHDLQNTFASGTGGAAFSSASCADGVDGEDVKIDAGTHVPIAGTARSLSATSPIVEGASTTLTFEAVPGDLAFALVSLQPGHLFFPAFQGTLLTDPLQFFVVFIGAVPPGGTLVFVAPTVPHGGPDEVVIQNLQSGWFTTSGNIRLGANASVVIQK